MLVIQSQVSCEVGLLNKSLAAEVAAEGSLPRMDAHVVLQQLIPRERSLAELAHVHPLA